MAFQGLGAFASQLRLAGLGAGRDRGGFGRRRDRLPAERFDHLLQVRDVTEAVHREALLKQIEQARQAKEKADAQEVVDQLQGVEDAIKDAADAQGVGDKIAFRFEGRGLVVTILNQAVLFKAGDALTAVAADVGAGAAH